MKEVHKLKKDNKCLKRKVDHVNELESVSEEYIREINNLELTNKRLKLAISDSNIEKKDLKSEFKILRQQYEEKESKLDNLEKKFEALKLKGKPDKIRNLNKKINYRDSQIYKRDSEINSLKEQISTLTDKIDNLQISLETECGKLSCLRDEKKSIKKKLEYVKGKLTKEKLSGKNFDIDSVKMLVNEVNHLTKEVDELRGENKDLNGLIALLQDDEIVTFQDGKYCNDVREVIMELLSLNVSMGKVNDVIKVVLAKLAKKNVNRLPSSGLKSRLMSEALIIAQLHVADEMLSSTEKDAGNCLHGDGTSKYHRNYQNFQVTTTSGKTLSFGLTEMAGGDAASTLQCLTETIDDICDVLDESDKEFNYSKLICSFKTTMSDLGSCKSFI